MDEISATDHPEIDRRDAEVKQFRCRHCAKDGDETVLGESDGRFLKIGGVAFFRPVTFICLACGREGKWIPAVKNSAKNDV